MEEDFYINSFYEYKEIIKDTNLFKIYKAFDKKNKNYVAIKIIEKSNLLIFNQIENIRISKKIKNEIYTLKKLDSSCFIKLIDFIESKNNYYIITELSNINLEDFIHKHNIDLTLEQIRNIFNKLNFGFNELINSKMFYYKIKISNILISFKEENNNLNINNIIPKINLFGLNNLLRTCHYISLIKTGNNYTLKKNNDSNIKSEKYFIETIENILCSLNSLRKENQNTNEEEKDFNNIINLCNSKINNDKLNLFNEYFNSNFWVNENEDKLSLNNLLNFNKKYNTTYNLYQKEIKYIINDSTTKEQLKEFSLIKFNFLNKLKLVFQNKDSLNELGILNIIASSINNNILFLDLSFNKIQNINELINIHLPNLLKLNLNDNQITDINILSKLTYFNLEEIDLSNNKISDISCFSEVPFKKLKILILDSNLILNLEVFKKVPFLETIEKLSLINNQITDIKVFRDIKFKKLKEFDISNNSLNDINQINSLFMNSKNSELEIISLNDIKLYDISKIIKNESFINLKEIDLGNNKIKDISALSNSIFRNLVLLNLSDNDIKDISVLENVPFNDIKTLDLSYNEINDISILKKCKFEKLYILNLCENKIVNIDILNECKFCNLFELNLSFNKIKNIDVLKDVCFFELEMISFRGNYINDIEVFKDVKIHYLQEIDLSENQINNIDVLNNDNIFGEVKYLDLRDNDIDFDLENNKIIVNKFKNKIIIE